MGQRRSRAYPNEDVVKAYELLAGKLRGLDSTPHTRQSLAKLLGYSSSSGGNAARKIASLVHYGFLERQNGRYSLGAFGRYVRSLEPGDPDWKGAMREAFQRPALFSEILREARRQGRIPEDLPALLESEYEVTPGASQTVARVFKDSGLVAGVFESSGIFKSEKAQSKVSPMPARPAANEDADKERARGPAREAAQADEPGSADRKQVAWSFPLPSGQTTLRIELPDLPENLSAEDFRQLERNLTFQVDSLQQMSRRIAAEGSR